MPFRPSQISSTLQVVSKTSTYTAQNYDFVIANTSSGGFTINLPSASMIGQIIRIKKVSSDQNYLTILPNGAETVEMSANLLIQAANTSVELISTTSTNWSIF